MSRTTGFPAIDAVLDDDFLIPVWFFEAQFPTGTLYMHTDIGTINTLGQDWFGAGDLGAITGVSQDDTGKPTKFEAILSAIDQTIIDEAINQNFFEREAILYLTFRDTITGVIVSAPIEVDRGVMDQMDTVTGGANAAVKLTVESEMIEFDRSLDLYYSDNQQQTEYSGDLIYQYLSELKDKKIVWAVGVPSVSFGGGGGGGSAYDGPWGGGGGIGRAGRRGYY